MSTQQHSGSGDNVAGNKTTNVIFNVRKKILLVAGLLIVLGGAVYYLFFNERIIQGHLRYRDNKPVENAELTVRSASGAELHKTQSDAEGQFELKQLYFFDKNLRLQVVQKQESYDFDLDSLIAGSAKEIVVYLNTAINPYKVTYYNLKGFSVDFLLEGYLKNRSGTNLEENIYVVQNSVYKNLKALKRKFNFSDSDSWDYATKDGRFARFTLSADQSTAGSNLFTNDSLRKDPYDTDSNMKSVVVAPVGLKSAIWGTSERNGLMRGMDTAIYDKKYEWHQDPEIDVVKWRYATREDLEGFDQNLPEYMDASWLEPGLNFLKYITREACPKEFMKYKLVNDEFGGCSDPAFAASIEHATLQLQAAVVENITDKLIEISAIEVKENPQKGLRTWDADQDFFEKTSSTKNIPIPPVAAKLKPGQSLIIPLNIQFKNGEKTYVYDPSISIQNVKINSYDYVVRVYDPHSLTISFSAEMGSCPYAYTWSETTNQWRVENHIIEGLSAPEKETYDTLPIRRFDGRLLLRENDPETSYLNLVSILAVDPWQGYYQWYPDVAAMAGDDGFYYTMNQGDTILLNFPKFQKQKDDTRKFYIVSKGYYLLYE